MSETFHYSKQNILLLITVVLSFTAFCIETDIYTPSFPDMVTYFGTNESRIQDILTWNFIGLCVSGLFFGPLSDTYGRKPLLSTGLVLFTISSIACTFVTNIEHLIFFRFLQGIGSGAITGVAGTMIFDAFPSKQSAQLITVLNSFVTGMMAAAPMIGSWLNAYYGWRMNFIAVAVLAVLSLFSALFLLTEPHPANARRPLSLKAILKDYRSLIFSTQFMANTFIWTSMFGLLIMYTANLSLIFVEYFGVSSEQFGYYQASIMGTFFICSLLAAKLIGKFGTAFTKNLGNVLFFSGTLILAALSLMGSENTVFLTASMSLASAGVAIACVMYYIDSTAEIPDSMGATVAFSQSIRLLVSAAWVGLAAKGFDGSMMPICMVTIAGVAFIGVLNLIVNLNRAKTAAI